MAIGRRQLTQSLAVLAGGLGVSREARAEKRYDVGASDTEIKIGQTIPYSGPVSSYGSRASSTPPFSR